MNKNFYTNSLLHTISNYSIYGFIILFGILYSIIAITKFNHYQTGLDLAIYVQTFWYYTHFKLPFVTLYPTFGDIVWADHFTPSLMLLTPFYFLWRDPRTLLILQSFMVVSGAYPIFQFAKEKLENTFLAYAFSFSFLTFFGVQFALTFDFHMAAISASFLPWILWALFKQKWKTYVILCIIASGFKEDFPLYVAALSGYLILSKKNWKLGVGMLLISLGYVITVTKFVMPSLAHHAAKVFSVSYFTFTPAYLYSIFFNSSIKMYTILLSFGYVLFLPIISGWFFLLPLAHFFINFASPDSVGRWGIFLHYRIHLSSILMFAGILGYIKLQSIIPFFMNTQRMKILTGILLILLSLFFDYKLHLPLNELFKRQFYFTEDWIRDNDAVLAKVPKDAYLLTMNSMAPQAAYREHVFYFPQNIWKTDYVVLDARKAQPPVNFWESADNINSYNEKVLKLMSSNYFSVVYQSHDAILLRRVKDFSQKDLDLYQNTPLVKQGSTE